MDLTVLHLAVPSLSAELKPTSVELLWIVDIYGFLVAGSLITMGTLGDRIGRRRLLLIGAAAFGTVSLLAAFSTSPAMLILSRALMGIAGATLAPSTLSLIFNMFSTRAARGRDRRVDIELFQRRDRSSQACFLEYFWWGSVFWYRDGAAARIRSACSPRVPRS
jgi:DHA2 family multidrug resistance protein-like MFS transporter